VVLPDFAAPPAGKGWTVRSHSDVDVVWGHPQGGVRYQLEDGTHTVPKIPVAAWMPPQAVRGRLWPRLTLAAAGMAGLVELVLHVHLWG
jgi:hypothetical protein